PVLLARRAVLAPARLVVRRPRLVAPPRRAAAVRPAALRSAVPVPARLVAVEARRAVPVVARFLVVAPRRAVLAPARLVVVRPRLFSPPRRAAAVRPAAPRRAVLALARFVPRAALARLVLRAVVPRAVVPRPPRLAAPPRFAAAVRPAAPRTRPVPPRRLPPWLVRPPRPAVLPLPLLIVRPPLGFSAWRLGAIAAPCATRPCSTQKTTRTWRRSVRSHTTSATCETLLARPDADLALDFPRGGYESIVLPSTR
ncbi:MAG TPA: hypothetical protein VFY20_05245, partial [Gemmatimonadales bacterium]|nr:hypothetical protein [Gemmatimonadales bacterium]